MKKSDNYYKHRPGGSRRRKIENRCSNCNKREDCKDRGKVVEWKHCRQFEVDALIVATEIMESKARIEEITGRVMQSCSD